MPPAVRRTVRTKPAACTWPTSMRRRSPCPCSTLCSGPAHVLRPMMQVPATPHPRTGGHFRDIGPAALAGSPLLTLRSFVACLLPLRYWTRCACRAATAHPSLLRCLSPSLLPARLPGAAPCPPHSSHWHLAAAACGHRCVRAQRVAPGLALRRSGLGSNVAPAPPMPCLIASLPSLFSQPAPVPVPVPSPPSPLPFSTPTTHARAPASHALRV